MTSTATQRPLRLPVLHGLKSLVEAQPAMPEMTKVLLNGGMVQYATAGAGKPPIVLIGGLGVPIAGWALVLPQLAHVGTVLAYNRLGVGASDKPRRPQTGTVVVDLLRELLTAAGLAAPCVLVGQGLGGVYANLYARRHPSEVAAVVLVEPAHPDDDVDERRLRFVPRSSIWLGSRRGWLCHAEHHSLAETRREIEQAGPFPGVPLTVVSGSRTPPRLTTSSRQIRTRSVRRNELVTLSPDNRHVLAPRSGQFPQVTDPQIVVRAVREILAP